MATKLKNTTRHWLFKWAAWLLIMTLGLNIIWSTYQQYTNNQDADFTQDYTSSSVYYKNLDAYYQKVYNAYLPDPKHPNPSLLAEVNSQKGYYYLIAQSDTSFYSNIKSLVDEDDFYSRTYTAKRIDSENYPEFNNEKSYFEVAPPSPTYIVIGLNYEQFKVDSEAYRIDWYDHNKNWIAFIVASLAGILFLMIYLATVSGRIPNSEEIHFNELDRIFIDVYLAIWIVFECLLLALITNSGYFSSELEYAIASMIFCAISGSIGLHYWMMVSKRIKSRTLLKHTLTAFIFRNTLGKVWKLFQTLFEKVKDGPLPVWSVLVAILFMAINIVSILIAIFFMMILGPFGVLVGIFSYGTGIALLAMYLVYQDQQVDRAIKCIEQIEKGDMSPSTTPSTTKQFTKLFQSINRLSEGFRMAVDKEVKAERMKNELISNVSHDIRTPLTSIITYVDLLKTKGLDDPEAPEFVKIIDQKSQRLKQLTDDLFEASKASSGILQVNPERIKLQDFMLQAMGEFEERFGASHLDLRSDFGDEPTWLLADGRHLWRTFENLFLNICNYAAPQSRVYLSSQINPDETVTIILKNISADPLNMSAESFLERFTRGDISRNTEGSGLGISIAKSLTELMGGTFQLETDGDLFKVMVTLPTQV